MEAEGGSRAIPVSEAAKRLGISADAVRKRIQRGTLQGYRVDRRWFVVLDGAGQQDAGNGNCPDSDRTALVAALRAEVDFLRSELLRKDQIIAALVQRVPPLPPPAQRRPWWQFWRRAGTE